MTVEGGSGDYQILWSNGATTAETSFATAGTYGVTVTDGDCRDTASVAATYYPSSPP